MVEVSVNKILKDNMLKLVKQHREVCNCEDCDISLALVLEVLQRANIPLSKDERLEFL
jgi:hypothetical protein